MAGKNDAEKSEVFVSCSGDFPERERERDARSDLYIIRILSAGRRMMGGGSEFVGIFHASINV